MDQTKQWQKEHTPKEHTNICEEMIKKMFWKNEKMIILTSICVDLWNEKKEYLKKQRETIKKIEE